MTYQRRRNGLSATFYPIVKRFDNRGNERKVHDEDNPVETKVWIFPQRGAKAEVTGQQTINVIKIGCTADLTDIALGSRVVFLDKEWDVVSPPALHWGARRHTRHWAMDVRERP